MGELLRLCEPEDSLLNFCEICGKKFRLGEDVEINDDCIRHTDCPPMTATTAPNDIPDEVVEKVAILVAQYVNTAQG